MKKIAVIAMMFSAVLLSAESTVNAAASDDPTSINADMQAVSPISSGMLMEQAFENFRVERGIAAYGTPDARGVVYFTGQSAVAANVNSPDFIRSRSSAYSKAYADAVAKLIMDRTGREVTKILRSESGDDSSDVMDFPKSAVDVQNSLERKIEALNEAEIDLELEKLGVDPQLYANTDTAAKRELYRNSLLTSVVRKAFGSAAGFLPVQTFETRSADGVYMIGVVLRSDPTTVEIAKALSVKQRPVISRNGGLTVEEALPSDDELLTQFGVRLYFDETGMPSLLSFGQYGSSYTGTNSRMAERALRGAFVQAENLANIQLTNFINSTMKIREDSLSGEEEVCRMLFRNDGSGTMEDFVSFIDQWSSNSETVGYDSMIGRSTVLRKTLKHPSGHTIAVVVRRWSFDKLDAENAVLNGDFSSETPRPAPAVEQEGVGVRSGRTYDF